MPELLVLKTAFGMPKLKGLRSMLSRPSTSGRLIPSIECRKVAGCVRMRNSVDDPELNQLLPSVHVIAAKHTWLSYRSGLTRFSVHLLLGPLFHEETVLLAYADFRFVCGPLLAPAPNPHALQSLWMAS